MFFRRLPARNQHLRKLTYYGEYYISPASIPFMTDLEYLRLVMDVILPTFNPSIFSGELCQRRRERILIIAQQRQSWHPQTFTVANFPIPNLRAIANPLLLTHSLRTSSQPPSHPHSASPIHRPAAPARRYPSQRSATQGCPRNVTESLSNAHRLQTG